MPNVSPIDAHARPAQPGRHRKTRSGARILGLPLVPTVGVAGALALIAGGTAAATGSTGHDVTTSLAAATKTDAAAQDSARTAAVARADRSRTAQVTATRKKTAAQRAAWLDKTAVAQQKLEKKVGAQVLGDDQVELTPKTLAAKRAATAATAAAAAARTAAAAASADATSIPDADTVNSSGRYVLPVSSGVNSDTFGMSGSHWANRHTGQDFPVPLGTGVHAVSSGKVLETGWAGAFGNRMKLLLDDGTEIWYCHLSSYVVTGGRVSAGEIVARSGSTGNSTGPHLHMEVHLNQNPTASDPLNWLRSKGLNI